MESATPSKVHDASLSYQLLRGDALFFILYHCCNHMRLWISLHFLSPYKFSLYYDLQKHNLVANMSRNIWFSFNTPIYYHFNLCRIADVFLLDNIIVIIKIFLSLDRPVVNYSSYLRSSRGETLERAAPRSSSSDCRRRAPDTLAQSVEMIEQWPPSCLSYAYTDGAVDWEYLRFGSLKFDSTRHLASLPPHCLSKHQINHVIKLATKWLSF